MRDFSFENSTRVLFGAGARLQVGEQIAGRFSKVLLLAADGPFRGNGVFSEILARIEAGGAQVVETVDISQNPKLSDVRTAVEACRVQGVECVVALGGGSAMDAAKVVAASAQSGIDPYEYIWGSRPTVDASLPVITIPTISATGTEVNDAAVIVNDQTKEKYWCLCKHPWLCVMDPELTVTVPVKLMVWGAMDILSHTFEYYFNGVTDALFQTYFSEALIHATMEAVEAVLANPQDPEPRGELMWAAAMAWGGLTKIGRGNADMTCHSIEESFSGYFDTHHGACLGVLTPRFMRMAAARRPEPFARFARNIFKITGSNSARLAEEGIHLYTDWLRRIGAPDTYADIGDCDFSEAELTKVADNAWRIYDGHIGVLCPWRYEDIRRLVLSGRISERG